MANVPMSVPATMNAARNNALGYKIFPQAGERTPCGADQALDGLAADSLGDPCPALRRETDVEPDLHRKLALELQTLDDKGVLVLTCQADNHGRDGELRAEFRDERKLSKFVILLERRLERRREGAQEAFPGPLCHFFGDGLEGLLVSLQREGTFQVLFELVLQAEFDLILLEGRLDEPFPLDLAFDCNASLDQEISEILGGFWRYLKFVDELLRRQQIRPALVERNRLLEDDRLAKLDPADERNS